MCPGLTPSVVAVDGGGTRCRLVLDTGAERFAVETGPANVATDFDAALGEIREGVDLLAEMAGMPPGEIAALPAYIGLAGATDRGICERVAGALPFLRVRVEEDRAAALQGALGPADGAIAHCGTGSFFGVRQDGRTRYLGGWGSRLGDEASAFWVAREALTGTLAVVDGLRPASALSDAFLARWTSPAGIVAFAAHASPEAVGRLAPEVADAGDKGDALGRDVLSRGAAHVAAMLDVLGWQPGLPICFTGGFGARYAPYLPDQMRAVLVEKRAEPIEGAIALARAFAMEAAA